MAHGPGKSSGPIRSKVAAAAALSLSLNLF